MILYFALLRLGFPSAPYLTQYLTSHHTSNSPDRSTKSTTSHLNVLCLIVNIGFQVLFHSPSGVLFNFPSRYYFTIGHQGVFSLGRWSSLLPTRFLVSCRTLESAYVFADFAYWTFTVSGMLSQNISAISLESIYCSPQPRMYYYIWFGLFCFRSPLLTESIIFFILLWVLRCFSSPRIASYILFYSYMDIIVLSMTGFPIRKSMIVTDICSLSWLIAACRVLLRLLMPRHSPYALISLT